MKRNASNSKNTGLINEKVVLRILRQHGELSQAQICEMTGLRSSTVSYITGRLREKNLINERTGQSTKRGAKPVILSINPLGKLIMSISINPGHVSIGLFDFNCRLLEKSDVFLNGNNSVENVCGLAETAAQNNVQFLLETPVTQLKKSKEGFLISTPHGDFYAGIVINAAGIHCKDVVGFLEKPDFDVYPCRGEYLILDKEYRSLIHSMIYPVPVKELGVLGIHITPTIEGNILLGPSAEFIDDPDDTRTTKEMMPDSLVTNSSRAEIVSTIGYSPLSGRLTSLVEGSPG